MDAHDGSQRDFLSSLFPMDQQNSHHQHHQQGLDGNQHQQQQQQQMYGFNPQQQAPQQSMQFGLQMPLNSQMTMDMLGNMMNMQGIDSQSNPSSSTFTPQALLEQQVKLNQLQQLQQLQNQILQTQIALISSQTAGMMTSPVINSQREPNQFSGLPTPGPSGDIAPRQPVEVPEMILNGSDFHQQDMNYPVSPLDTYQHSSHRYPMSAPEHIAFPPLNHTQAPDLNLDVSPMTSPGLTATTHAHNKRNASSSGDESHSQRAKKRQSPAIRPVNPTPTTTRRHTRGTKSASSTPLFQSTRSNSRRGSIVGESPGDSPSPVDLSMPPPAPPASASHHGSSPSQSMTSSPAFNPQIMPVTPGSIMNLGRLGSRSSNAGASTSRNTGNAQPQMGGATVQFNVEPTNSKNSAPSTPKIAATTGEPTRRTSTRKTSNAGNSLVSPALKAIRPAGSTPTMGATQPGTSTPILTPLPDPVIRKSSHKAAEQKRRDSLKAKYDELRLLLPPIALPTDERYPDEPILPGALPPRGPPKAGQEGPNKAVSKLQLLMCGNDYIRQLKGRVDRRDDEIEKLRQEIRRLRIVVEQAGIQDGFMGEGEDGVDLEKDLDSVENFSLPVGSRFGGVGTIMEDDGDEDD